MDASLHVLLNLFIVFAAAQIGAELAQRLKLPAMVGEIVAGVLVSASVFNLIALDATLEGLSEIGAVLLLFAVGLETRIADLRRVGAVAFLVALLGVIVPFVTAGFWAWHQGLPLHNSMFVGAAFVATSVGITARVLYELGVLDRIESRVILGAAVIDDILGMLLLGVVTSFQSQGSVNVIALALIVVQAIAFIVVVGFIGARVMRSRSTILDMPINPHSPLTLSLLLCLGLAAAAVWIHLAAIIGAFLAGLIIAESSQREILQKQLQPLTAFLVPFFFVATGARVDLGQFAGLEAVGAVALVTVLAIVSKLLGCGLGALSLGRRSALLVGVGMAPRGEVGIIIASLGLKAGVFSPRLYGIIISMSLLTSILTPPALKLLLRRTAR